MHNPKSMKGMENLIAAMLLLVFTLGIAAIVLNWTGAFTFEKKELTEKQANQISECSGIAIAIQNVYSSSDKKISKIDVQNTGTKEALLRELRIVGTNATCMVSFERNNNSIVVGDFKSINISNCDVSCGTYQSSTIQTICQEIRDIHLKSDKVNGC